MEKLIEYIKSSAESLNQNKYIIGFAMILLNIGARFIIDELDDDTRSLTKNKFVRRFFVFCSFFMATRDIFKAIFLTIIFIIIMNELLAKEVDGEEEVKGGSYNKNEIDKMIQQLKNIQATL